jgi:ligand-binding SRPBCC domain-containing protein
MEHVLETAFEIPLRIEEVFAFFSEAANLQRITPPELNFEILTPLPIEIRLGTVIEYRLSLFGLRFRWASRITEWDPPWRFVDEQLRGPYGLWVHTHTFAVAGVRTRIEDHVRYRLPLSPIGDVAYPMVRRQLKRIFKYRERAVLDALLARRLGSTNETDQGQSVALK